MYFVNASVYFVNAAVNCALLSIFMSIARRKQTGFHGSPKDRTPHLYYVPILVKVDQKCDRMNTFTMNTDGDYTVNSVPVYQIRRAEPVPQKIAAA